MSMDRRVVLITGAGSGIGRASAQAFAADGAIVIAADLDGASAEETVAQLEGAESLALAGDVSSADDMAAMVHTVIERFGRLDVLYQNAGIPQAARPVEEIPLAEWHRIIAVNLTSLFIGAQLVAPIMKQRRSGVILITASIAALRPRPGLSAYVASKGGAVAFTKALALELAPFGVRVNAISPVAVRTPMLTRFGFGSVLEEAEQRFVSTIPLGRLTTAEDVAAAAVYLASDAAGQITGIDLQVDGGRGV